MSTSKKNDEPAGPKVLRIGIVQKGKIVDEREMKKRETISVGSAEKSTFSVASDAMPDSFDLFDYDGKDYFLRYTAQMEGRIQLTGDKVKSFDELKREGKVVNRKGDAVKLNDSSRGKVIIGDVTVLFQFKTAVAAPVRPGLPPEIRGSLLQNIDAQFTAIFVVVALLQISIVTYARSLPYIEPTSIEQIDQSYQRLIMPDRAPEPPKDVVADATGSEDKTDETKKKDEPKKDSSAKKDSGKSKEPLDAEAAARARKDAISKQVAGKGLLRVLGANREGGGDALADVFEEGGGAVGGLGDAFSGIQGVDIADSGGASGTRGGGSGEGVGIGDLGTEGGGSVKTGGKTEAAVKGQAKTEAPEVDGELSEAEIASVMRRNLKALQSCYESALKRDRTLKGKITIRFEIQESGRTANIEFDDKMGSSDVVSCIRTRAKSWRFPRPDGGSVFVAYPIVFTPSG